MRNQTFEHASKLTQFMSPPLGEWGRLTMDICCRTAQQNLEMMGENLLLWSDQLKKLDNAKQPEDWLMIQKDFFNEAMSAGVENWQRLTNLAMENIESMSNIAGSAPNPVHAAARGSSRSEKSEKNAK